MQKNTATLDTQNFRWDFLIYAIFLLFWRKSATWNQYNLKIIFFYQIFTENQPISLSSSPYQKQWFVNSAKYLRGKNETAAPNLWNCKLCFPYTNHGQQKHIKAKSILILRCSERHYTLTKYIISDQIQTSFWLIKSLVPNWSLSENLSLVTVRATARNKRTATREQKLISLGDFLYTENVHIKSFGRGWFKCFPCIGFPLWFVWTLYLPK